MPQPSPAESHPAVLALLDDVAAQAATHYAATDHLHRRAGLRFNVRAHAAVLTIATLRRRPEPTLTLGQLNALRYRVLGREYEIVRQLLAERHGRFEKFDRTLLARAEAVDRLVGRVCLALELSPSDLVEIARQILSHGIWLQTAIGAERFTEIFDDALTTIKSLPGATSVAER